MCRVVGLQGCMYKASPPFGSFDNRLDALAELKKQMAVLEDMADEKGTIDPPTAPHLRDLHPPCLEKCNVEIDFYRVDRLLTSSVCGVVALRAVPDGCGEVHGRRDALRHGGLPRADPAQPLRMVRQLVDQKGHMREDDCPFRKMGRWQIELGLRSGLARYMGVSR